MKSKEEIEQLADKFATSIYGFRNENHNNYLECKRNCIEFYTQCQEDMADKKYTEEDIRKAFNAGDAWGRADYIGNNQPFADEDEFINSLNKQD